MIAVLIRTQRSTVSDKVLAKYSFHGITENVVQVHTQTYIRNRYLKLYRRHLEQKLMSAASASEKVPSTPAADGLKSSLGVSESKELEEIHRTVNMHKLLVYRAMVHKGLKDAGFTIQRLKQSLTNNSNSNSTYSSYLLGIFGYSGRGKSVDPLKGI